MPPFDYYEERESPSRFPRDHSGRFDTNSADHETFDFGRWEIIVTTVGVVFDFAGPNLDLYCRILTTTWELTLLIAQYFPIFALNRRLTWNTTRWLLSLADHLPHVLLHTLLHVVLPLRPPDIRVCCAGFYG